MAVGNEQIDPAVVVVIEKLGSPADIRKADRRHSGIVGNVRERIAANVAVKHIVFIVEVSDEYVEPSVVIIVTQRDAHTALLGAVSVNRHARFEPDLLKRAVPVVMVEIVRRRVVGDVNIYPAIAIKVTGENVQPVVTYRIVAASLLRQVRKRSVAVLVIERDTPAWQSPRASHHRNSKKMARPSRAKRG